MAFIVFFRRRYCRYPEMSANNPAKETHMKSKLILLIGLFATSIFAAPTPLPTGTNKNTWMNCTVSSVAVLSGNKLMVNVSGCADATYSLFYIVDPAGNFGSPTSIEEL